MGLKREVRSTAYGTILCFGTPASGHTAFYSNLPGEGQHCLRVVKIVVGLAALDGHTGFDGGVLPEQVEHHVSQ